MVLIANSDSQSTINLPIQIGDSSTKFMGAIFDVTDVYERIISPPQILEMVKITVLPGKQVMSPIEALVMFDETHYLAECIEIPIYATGQTKNESISNLKDQIAELYDELINDNELSDEWVIHKLYLKGKIK